MDEVGQAIQLILQHRSDILAIYLFGSHGTPYENKESDLDIAILPLHPFDSLQRWQLAQEVAYAIHRDVDLIDLTQASTVLRFQIIGLGKRVFCSNPFASDLFETTTYSAYVRFNDERRELLDAIKKRGRILNG